MQGKARIIFGDLLCALAWSAPPFDDGGEAIFVDFWLDLLRLGAVASMPCLKVA